MLDRSLRGLISLTALEPTKWTAEALDALISSHVLMRLSPKGRWAVPVASGDTLPPNCFRLHPPGPKGGKSPLLDYFVFVNAFTPEDLNEMAWELGRLSYQPAQYHALTLETIVSFSFPEAVLAIPLTTRQLE